jgi:hypothetical protein
MASIAQDRVKKTESLPVDAQVVVTEVRLDLFGELSGDAPATLRADLGANRVDYQPLPIQHIHQHADHAQFGATLIDDLDDGIDPFLFPEDISYTGITTNEANLTAGAVYKDADPSTSESPAALGSEASIDYILAGSSARIFGFVLRYEAPWVASPSSVYAQTGTPARVRFRLQNNNAGNDNYARVLGWWAVPYTDSGEPRTIIAVVPPNHAFSQWNQPDPLAGKSEDVNFNLALEIDAITGNIGAAADVKVFHFYPLVLNETLLDSIGASKARVPSPDPKQITVSGHVTPDASHTFPGWPGGSLDVDVARQHHAASRTVIDVEQEAGPTPNPDGSQGPAQLLQDALATRSRMERINRKSTYALRLARRR